MQAAERAGVEHFVFFSSLGASSHDRTRALRAKALAERAVEASDVRHTIFAPSLVYAPGDRLLRLFERMAMVLPVMPLSGRGAALYEPIWADDVADCVMRHLGHAPGRDGLGATATSASSSPARRRCRTARSSSSCCARPDARARSSASPRRSSPAACAPRRCC